MKKPSHVILTLTPIDKKKAQVGMPPREQIRTLLDTLDRTPVLVMGNRVWQPIGIVYEETTQYTTNPIGFYPRGSIPEMGIMEYIAGRAECPAEPLSSSEPATATPSAEPGPRGRRKIIIKDDKRGSNGSNKDNATKN